MMQSFNEAIFSSIWNISGKNFLLDGISILSARYLGYVVIIGTIFLLLRSDDWRGRVMNFCKLFLALVLVRGIGVSIIKFFYSYPRPAEVLSIKPLISVSGNSFPAEIAVALFIFVFFAFSVSKKWATIFLAASIFSALAQIYTGIHWPVDVLGGALIGLIGAFFVDVAAKKYEKRLNPKHSKNEVPITQT